MSAHLLIVDDDAEIRELLSSYLLKNGYRVSTAADGSQMQERLTTEHIDLLILDLMLPGEDGLTLCRNLRVSSNLPIIMLTARGDDLDRILGLEMGADDYLAKPFNPRELLARIRGVLRRSQTLVVDPEAVRRYHFAGWSLEVGARHLVSPTGVVTPLGGGEFRLLRVFLEHPQRVLNRDQLMDLTQGREASPFDRSIDVQISRLRRRLGDDPRQPVIIKTIRHEGYQWTTTVTREG